MDSILNSVKKFVGLDEDYEIYDDEIIADINTIIAVLTQVGIGPDEGFTITDEYSTWEEFVDDDPKFNMVRSYIQVRVKLMFDPPTSSALLEALKESVREFEWRLGIGVD